MCVYVHMYFDLEPVESSFKWQDCDHATTLIDISGTLDGSLVSGLKYSSFCGFQALSQVPKQKVL